MGLTNVWVQTLGDGLLRADQITGIDAHQTPALTGKPSRWLLDAVISVATGSGGREGWTVTALHRTLIQTSEDPGPGPLELARLLARLDTAATSGVITATREDAGTPGGGGVRFRFTPFTEPAPDDGSDAEYL